MFVRRLGWCVVFFAWVFAAAARAQECSPDTTPPTMVLVGAITQVVELDSTYVDPGVDAFDACDGDVGASVVRTGDIDTSTPGVYVLRYDVSDQAGNAAPPIFRQPVVTAITSAPCTPVVECPPNPIAPGGNATFTVTKPCLQGNLVYQLMFNGVVIQTSDTGSFTIDQVDCDDAGWYTIAISNSVTTIYVRCELIIEPCGEGEGHSDGEGEGEGSVEAPPCDLFPTCFSGLQYPLPSSPPYAANASGFVTASMNVQEPVVPPTTPPVDDVNWQPLGTHNETGVPWTATVLGQIFGIALDNATPPNRYVTATSVYGDFPAGPGGYGAVYRIDGVTGNVCVLATLPNAGPALGNVCYDEVNSQLFVTNHEDGLIYRIPIDNSCTPSGTITTFDHGVAGRVAAGFAAIPDAATLNTYTALGRRVWGVENFAGRLFYSVWWENDGRFNPSEANEIWSVALDGSGAPIAATTQRELQMPPRGGGSNPVSDINFSASGAMFVSERTMTTGTHPAYMGETGDRGLLHLGLRPAHTARLMKFNGPVGGPWITNNEFRVGSFGSGENSSGGAVIDCQERPWATGDALHFGSSTGHTDVLYGVHRIDAPGNALDVPFTLNGVVIGFGSGPGGFAKTEIGDVELWCPGCSGSGVEGEGAADGEGSSGPCEKISTSVCLAGIKDQFSLNNGPETTTPSNALLAAVTCQIGPLTLFDVIPDAQCFVHTFTDCCLDDCEIIGATLEIGLKAASIGIPSSDDTISLGTGGVSQWSLPLANVSASGTYQSGNWNPGDMKIVTLDLASLPLDANPVNNTSVLSALCDLDVLIEDVTQVDYMRLSITRCCDVQTGDGEGQPEGHPDGEGTTDGQREGEGHADGEGATDGQREGEGQIEGQPDGQADGEGSRDGEGSVEGVEEGGEEGEDPTGPCANSVSWPQNQAWENGYLFNVDIVGQGDDKCIQLAKAEETVAWPYIAIANSGRDTITRVDVNTGNAVGEYKSRPDGKDGNPSRTTVDAFGNVWFGNRNEGIADGKGSVTRVGLVVGGTRVDAASNPDPNGDYVLNPSYCTCEDRDFDGLIKTSKGYPWVNGVSDYTPTYLPWQNTGGVDSNGGVSTAEDECITAYVRVAGTNVRFVAVDPFNNIWTGGLGNRQFQKITNATAAVVPASVFNSLCGGYGGLVDGNNVIWSAYWSGYGDGFMRYDVPFTSSPLTCVSGVLNYGVAIDPDTCNIWTTSATFDNIARVVSPSGTLLSATYNHHGSATPGIVARGIVIDKGVAWVAHSGSNTVGRLTTSGVHQGNVVVGSGPTGVAVDTNGKIWSANLGTNNASRIDPTAIPGTVDLTVDLGPGSAPYNYSDMTGTVLLKAVAPQGSWTNIYDGGVLGCVWSPISWVAYQDPGTTVVVQVRASDSPTPSGPWTVVQNNVPFSGVVGRYLQIQIIMIRPAGNKADCKPSEANVKVCNLKICKDSGCMAVTSIEKDCNPLTGDITTDITVTNLSGVTASSILITPQTPNVTITPSPIGTNLPNGATQTYTVTVSGAVPGTSTCFTVTLLNKQGQVCCSKTFCTRFDCAACLEFLQEKVVCDPDNPGGFLYTFQIKNRTADTLQHLYLTAPAGSSISPTYIPLTPPLAPSQVSAPITVSIASSLAAGAQLCFEFSAHDKELNRCCYGTHCITLPDCGQGGEGEGHADGEGGVEAEGPCKTDIDCDDGNPCTADFCDPATGDCTHEVVAGCEGEHDGEGCIDQREETCDAGIFDQFADTGVEVSSPSAALLAAVDCPGGPLTNFDQGALRQCFVHTFGKCCMNNCKVLEARLVIALRANPLGTAFVTSDDRIQLGSNGLVYWSLPIANLTASGQWTTGSWNPGNTTTITLDLMNLPTSANPAQNIDITGQFAKCELDVMVKDYTAVDYMRFELVKCCDGSSTGNEGAIDGEGQSEGQPVPCDTVISCPNQVLQAGSVLTLCLSNEGDCVGSNRVYRWYRNGALVATTAGPCLTISPVTCAMAGVYTVQLSGSSGTYNTPECKIKVSPCPHAGDTNGDGTIELHEALRIIQLFNSEGLRCSENSEDGFAPGPGKTNCLPHASDYNPQDWKLQLSELLRLIQLYGQGSFYPCPDAIPPTEDGYCLGTP
ncbi:MAG: DUF5011 domain-containing protein [Candidatus Hydrogenedens sp.]|nr:DUF5011 domain-containing protein [Candidatus Hydrogenedens sp.]